MLILHEVNRPKEYVMNLNYKLFYHHRMKRSMFFTSFVIFAVLSLGMHSAKAQLPKNLVYANENLNFDKLFSLGKYKMLYAVDYKKQRNRFAYLLDEANLVVDTMKVDGNDYFLMRSDSTFSISSLGDYYEITVRNGQFEADLVLNITYQFGQKFMGLFHKLGGYLIGTKYNRDNDCISYHYFKASDVEAPKAIMTGKPTYGVNDSTQLFFINEKEYEKITGKNYDNLAIESLFDFEKSCQNRTKFPYYGWAEASLDNDQFTFYQRSTAKVYTINVAGEPELEAEIELPLDAPKKEGWKYLFDAKTKKHYATKRIELAPTEPLPKKKRKRKNLPRNYRYELYELQRTESTMKLKPLYKLSFDPVMIDNDLVYEVVQESKKGSAIYFHPLDPDYVYEKSTLIYSEGG